MAVFWYLKRMKVNRLPVTNRYTAPQFLLATYKGFDRKLKITSQPTFSVLIGKFSAVAVKVTRSEAAEILVKNRKENKNSFSF